MTTISPRPTVGSVVSMTAATGTATLRYRDGIVDTAPLIGFAVVVRWVSTEDGEYETAVEPVVLADGELPVTLRDWTSDHTGYPRAEVVLR